FLGLPPCRRTGDRQDHPRQGRAARARQDALAGGGPVRIQPAHHPIDTHRTIEILAQLSSTGTRQANEIAGEGKAGSIMSQVIPSETKPAPIPVVRGPGSWWQRLLDGVRRLYVPRSDWSDFVGADWPDTIMQAEVTDDFHAKQGRSTGRWVLETGGKQLV